MVENKEGLILVVDDEKEMRETTKSILESLGFQVITASDGFEALAIIENKPTEIKIITTDHCMPRMNGLALLKIIRKKGINTSVISICGSSGKDERDLYKAAGAIACLEKPYRIDEIKVAIEAALKK